MKISMKHSIYIASALIISGCAGAMPVYKESKSSFIIFKTPTLKYADQGFISKADNETKVEIYSNGQSVMRLRILPNQVCITQFKCMDKKEFNQKVLASANYPDNLIENIFNAKPIFNGKNLKGSSNHFIQKIGTITYKVDGKNISFLDKSNGDKIEVRYE